MRPSKPPPIGITRRSDTSHVVAGNDCARCLHCGAEQAIAMPCSIDVFVAITQAFLNGHRACKPTARGRARMEYSSPFDWIQSWDTGASSETIWHFMMHGAALRPSVPHDSDDFGRCYRLLAAFPEWRARMPEMRDVPGWAKFVDNWNALTVLYEAELAGGVFTQTYARLRDCR